MAAATMVWPSSTDKLTASSPTDANSVKSNPIDAASVKPEDSFPSNMSTSAPPLSPFSSFYLLPSFQSFPFPSPSSTYPAAAVLGSGSITAGDLAMSSSSSSSAAASMIPTPGSWVDYNQYTGFLLSPGAAAQFVQSNNFFLNPPQSAAAAVSAAVSASAGQQSAAAGVDGGASTSTGSTSSSTWSGNDTPAQDASDSSVEAAAATGTGTPSASASASASASQASSLLTAETAALASQAAVAAAAATAAKDTDPATAIAYFPPVPPLVPSSSSIVGTPTDFVSDRSVSLPEQLMDMANNHHANLQSMFVTSSPSPSESISPAMLNTHHDSVRRPASTTATTTTKHAQNPSSRLAAGPQLRASFDSTISMNSVDGGLRSIAPSVHSSDGDDFAIFGEPDHDHDHDHDQDDALMDQAHDTEGEGEGEGSEMDGMMWGMKTVEYKSLSARERKRVRNRISARTFRARRKEHLSSLEHTLSNKDTMIRKLQEENAELKRRLSHYEKPYQRPVGRAR